MCYLGRKGEHEGGKGERKGGRKRGVRGEKGRREGGEREERREREERGREEGEGECVTWCWLQFIVVGFLDHFNHVTLVVRGVASHVTSILRSCDISTKIM